jgi:hypothetical protein
MADLTDTIEDAAATPAAAAQDGLSATARSIPDLITADKYLKGTAAATDTNANGGPRSGWSMLRTARATPGGTV